MISTEVANHCMKRILCTRVATCMHLPDTSSLSPRFFLQLPISETSPLRSVDGRPLQLQISQYSLSSRKRSGRIAVRLALQPPCSARLLI